MIASTLSSARRQAERRSRQVKSILANEGHRGITDRARTVVADWMRPKGIVWQVKTGDVIAADLSQPFTPIIPKVAPGESITVNWVTGPAGPGSGGHTTCYRIIRYLDRLGYTNRIYFYDLHRADRKYYEDVAREHYGLTNQISDMGDTIADAHAVVATGWPTAYPVFNARCTGKRFYFVQDFEPYFEPVGAQSVLAENTYKMGFHAITAGQWLAKKLKSDYGMEGDYFPFGCDTTRYKRDPGSKRSGVAFYARAGTPRRGVELGLLALEIFAKRQPQIDIHLYGEKLADVPFRAINHGLVSPQQLNTIYNKCFAGLTLSLTNLSLVPYEMLAAGCIPVMNDAEHNRMVMQSDHVRYAETTPHALASALEKIVVDPDYDCLSRKAADSIVSASWDDAGAAVDTAFRRALCVDRDAVR
ncbi:glycosyltransferase family 1 protein [Mesorhizobium sp. CN2-181]|uniref:rhamnosyltransferase WsaF family glycosyltransferase n=1 Tax=Mesorhizobium yinganensis TaxID=3157707 RepID=UPI0032B7F7DB